ncbi:MAG TPA: hypothetical protein VJT15_20235 [Pyrinomonadaceae bacterium]|nr:hypothetical protein [Pyrinomonadaceae bacterium]
MFEKDFTTHQNRIASAPSKSDGRKMSLQTGIEFAHDAIDRLDADEMHAAGEFRRRKAEWGRHVENDEKPREIPEHLHASRNYRGGGICAIGIEVGIATYAFYKMLESYGLPFAVSLALALVLALVITLPLAYLFHGAIHYLVTRLSEPAAQLKRLTVYFVYLSLAFVAVSIVAYVALFRLDPETVYALQGVLSAMKFVAMFGFMVLGAALLVAADLYGWSRSRARKYKAILDERLAIAGKRREWQNEVAIFAGQITLSQQTIVHAQQASAQPTSPNGTSVGTATATTTVIGVLLMLGALSGFSACTPAAPKVRMVSVQEQVVCDVVIDASGDPDGSDQLQEETRQKALRQAGLNVVESVKKTVAREHVTELNLFWLAENGWMIEKKLTLAIPSYKRAEVVRRDAGEFDDLRPDVAEVEKQRNAKALAEAEAQISAEYLSEIEKVLARLNVDTVIPPSTTDSRCTDLNGMMARFSEPNSAVRRILYVVTDGRQSCGDTAGINKVTFPQNTAVIIVLIPGVDADGRDDFEQRRAMFTEACASCDVVPFFSPDLDTVAAESFKKRNSLASRAKE